MNKNVYSYTSVVQDEIRKFRLNLPVTSRVKTEQVFAVRLPSDPVIIEWTMAARDARECMSTRPRFHSEYSRLWFAIVKYCSDYRLANFMSDIFCLYLIMFSKDMAILKHLFKI